MYRLLWEIWTYLNHVKTREERERGSESEGTLCIKKALESSDQLETLSWDLHETPESSIQGKAQWRYISSSRLLESNCNSFSSRHNSQAEPRGSWGCSIKLSSFKAIILILCHVHEYTHVCVYSWKLFTYMFMDMDLFKLTDSPNSIRKMFLPCLDLVFVCSTSFSYSLPQTSAFSSSALLASKVNLPHKEGCTGPQGLYSRTPI